MADVETKVLENTVPDTFTEVDVETLIHKLFEIEAKAMVDTLHGMVAGLRVQTLGDELFPRR